MVLIYFPGANSRWYQIANQISASFRQGLLLHEVVHALNKPQSPIVGNLIERAEIEAWASNPAALWLGCVKSPWAWASNHAATGTARATQLLRRLKA